MSFVAYNDADSGCGTITDRTVILCILFLDCSDICGGLLCDVGLFFGGIQSMYAVLAGSVFD